MALGGTVLFTPHLAPMTRGILATCYGEATGPCDPLEALRAAYADEPFVHVTADPPATKWVAGLERRQLTARYDERTGRVLALAAIDNLGKGAAGQMIQCANLMLGLDETAGLTTMRSLSMSVTAAEGFVAAGCHAGIKRRKFDMALLATDDGQPVPCAAVFTQNKFAAPPVELDRATLAANGGKAAAVIVNSGNANAGTGAAGLQGRAADGRGGRRGAAGRQRARPGLLDRDHRHAAADGRRSSTATPKLAKKLSVEGARRCGARASSPPTTSPSRSSIQGSTFTLGGMAKGCGMIAPNMATMLAFLTTDADVPRAVMQKALKARVGRDLQHAQRRRRDLDQRHRDAARLGPARQGRSGRVRQRRARRLPRPHHADGARRRRDDADGAPHRHRRGQRRRSADRGQERSSRTISSNAAGTAAIPIGAG